MPASVSDLSDDLQRALSIPSEDSPKNVEKNNEVEVITGDVMNISLSSSNEEVKEKHGR